MNTSTRVVSTGVETAGVLAALANPVRLAIVTALSDGERCVCDLQELVPIAGNLLSHHLRVLREASLVTATRRGRWIDYQINGAGFIALWSAMAASGVPLPGEPIAAGHTGRACTDEG